MTQSSTINVTPPHLTDKVQFQEPYQSQPHYLASAHKSYDIPLECGLWFKVITDLSSLS